MQGKIRGFMHLDNGQEAIPAFVADTIRKASEHSHTPQAQASQPPLIRALSRTSIN